MLSFKVEASVSLDIYNAKLPELNLYRRVISTLVGVSGLTAALTGADGFVWLGIVLLWAILRWPVFAIDAGRLADRQQSPYRALADFVPFLRTILTTSLGLPSPDEVVLLGLGDATIRFGDYEFISKYAPTQFGYTPAQQKYKRLSVGLRAENPLPSIDEKWLDIAMRMARSARDAMRDSAPSSNGRPGYTWVRETPTRRGHWRKLR